MLEVPDGEEPSRIADWVELELSVELPSLSRSKVASVVSESAGADVSEAFTSDVWQHLHRRIARYATSFFRIEDDIVLATESVPANALEYKSMLLFSVYGASIQEGAEPKLFERTSAEAICNYLGGRVFVFGWPVLNHVQVEIAARVRQVADLMKERFVEAPAVQYLDRGVDIIAWKPFPEPDATNNRTSQIVMLSQCAAGRGWRDKTRELPLASWTQYLHWATDPEVGFAAAAVIDDHVWHDVAREVEGVVFDRIRLINFLPNGVQDADLRNDLETWVGEQVTERSIE